MDAFASRYRGIAFGILSVAVVGLSFSLLLPFVPAILWAIVLSILLFPIHQRLLKRFSPNFSAMISVLTTIVIVVAPLAMIGGALFFQVTTMASTLPPPIASTVDGEAKPIGLEYVVFEADKQLAPIYTKAGVKEGALRNYYVEHKQEINQSISKPLGKAIFQVGFALFTIVVALLSMFFMLRDGPRLKEPALELIPLRAEQSEGILAKMADTVRAVFIGVVLVALIQGLIAGITYWALGIPNPFMWGLATVVLCTIPLLGAPILYVPMAGYLAMQGDYVQAVILLAVGFLIVSQIDNLLRPFIIGAKVNLHPLAVFFSLLGGIFFFGPVGLMAGPMLLTLLLGLQDIIRLKMKEGSDEEASAT